ncbi:MAG: O-antigen ligase family protein [Acidobacteria bacterium]|nr:O-antigen ligase family protein [Acidobacteriota bacterium]
MNSLPNTEVSNSRYSQTAFVMLLAVPILATIFYGAVDPAAQGLLAVSGMLILALWALDSFKRGRIEFSVEPLQAPLAALILLGFVQLLPLGNSGAPPGVLGVSPSSALSFDPFATRMFIVRLAAVLIFFAAALVFVRGSRRVRLAALTIITFGSLMAFVGILQWLAKPDAIYGLRPTPQAIPFGSFVNQHHFAAFMEMTIGLGLGIALGSGLKRSMLPLLITALVLMTIAVVLTGSRGGILSLGAVVITLLSATYFARGGPGAREGTPRSRRRALTGLLGTLTGVVLLLVLVIALGGADNLLRGVGFGSASDDPTSGRLHFWRVALEIFKANPLVGAGLDAFGNAFPLYDTRNGSFRVEQAHNDYLQMLADGGLIGFAITAAFLVMLAGTCTRCIRSAAEGVERSVAIGATAGIVGILAHSFVDFPLRTTSNAYIFFLLIAVMVGAGAVSKKAPGPGHERTNVH